jgi:putative peptidoglycan lipid II flippase
MRYATTLVQMILGLVAAAISLAVLPTLARHATAGDEAAFRSTLARALAMTAVLILPATLGLAAIGRPTVTLLFQHGATGEDQGRQIAIALFGYLPGAMAAAFDQVLIFAFYARRDTRTPVLVGVLAVGIYLLVALPLVRPLGMLGLVLANSAQWTVHALVMWWLARRRFGRVGDDGLIRTTRRTGIAAAVTALAAFLCWAALATVLPAGDSVGVELLVVAAPAILGVLVYVGMLSRLHVEEYGALRATLQSRFRRQER